MRSLRLGVAFVLAVSGSGAMAENVASATGAELRALDRMSGELTDLDLNIGESTRLDRLTISLVECRYPIDNPNGDAYAYLLIDEDDVSTPVFEGWMVASSPALNPFDHIRYDVWVLRCNMS